MPRGGDGSSLPLLGLKEFAGTSRPRPYEEGLVASLQTRPKPAFGETFTANLRRRPRSKPIAQPQTRQVPGIGVSGGERLDARADVAVDPIVGIKRFGRQLAGDGVTQ